MSEQDPESFQSEYNRDLLIEEAIQAADIHPVLARNVVVTGRKSVHLEEVQTERDEMCFAVGSSLMRNKDTQISHRTGKTRFAIEDMMFFLNSLPVTEEWATRIGDLDVDLLKDPDLADRAEAVAQLARRMRAGLAAHRTSFEVNS